MTQRDWAKIVGLGLAPAALTAAGYALHITGPLLAVYVALVGVCCVAAGLAIGWRT